MKIAIDVTPMRVDGSVGGVMNLSIELIEGFIKKENIQLVLLGAYWNKEFLKKFISKNVTLIEVIKKSTPKHRYINLIKRVYSKLLKFKSASRILHKENVDILFCPFSAATYNENGIPTVSTINDIQHDYYPQFFTPEENHNRTKFYKDISKKVEGVICISNYTKKTFCEKYNYDEDRAYTVYIAIQNRFKNEDNTILKKLKLEDSAYIVYPANFWEHKNHKILLNAFSMYTQKDDDAKLVLTGNTLGKEEELEKIIDKMGLNNRIIIAGYLKNEELYSIIKNAKGLIFPSLFEGFGIPVVEAMHINKLISCSNVTSLPEIGCNSIFYFNPAKPDEVMKGIEYIFNTEMTDDIINDYKLNLEKFNFNNMINNYLDVFHKVINNQSKIILLDKCEGIYQDGWSSTCIQMQFNNKQNQMLSMNISLPEFVKQPIKFSILYDNKEESYNLKPGQSLRFNWKITTSDWSLEILIKRSWIPSKVLNSEDNRELGFIVDELTLNTNDKVINLLQMEG